VYYLPSAIHYVKLGPPESFDGEKQTTSFMEILDPDRVRYLFERVPSALFYLMFFFFALAVFFLTLI